MDEPTIIWNVIVAASNWYGLRAVRNANPTDKWLLLAAMTSSTIYHLHEKSKHNMRGIGTYEYQWLNLDRLFTLLCVIRFLSKYQWNKSILFFGLLSLGCMCVSESDRVVKCDLGRFAKPVYVVTHVLWHIGAFHTAHLVVLLHKKRNM